MATVAKNIRMRKFYGIVSLKTDIIFISDIRLCNKSGVGDYAFANKIFATNPYGSYTFLHNSRTNCRGVDILVKKSLNFACLGEERDRGYEVTLVSKPGWRATKGSVAEMVEKVKEALCNISPHDVVVVQLLDNTCYLARSDEGRDLPIRR